MNNAPSREVAEYPGASLSMLNRWITRVLSPLTGFIFRFLMGPQWLNRGLDQSSMPWPVLKPWPPFGVRFYITPRVETQNMCVVS